MALFTPIHKVKLAKLSSLETAANAITYPKESKQNLRLVKYQTINLRNIDLAENRYLLLSIPPELSFSHTQLAYLINKQNRPIPCCFNWQFLGFKKLNKQNCLANINNLICVADYDFNYQRKFTLQLLCELLGLCLELVLCNQAAWYLSNLIMFDRDRIFFSVKEHRWYLVLLPLEVSNKQNLEINTIQTNYAVQAQTDIYVTDTSPILKDYQRQVQDKLDELIQFCLKNLQQYMNYQSKNVKGLFMRKKAMHTEVDLTKIYTYINSDTWPELISYLAKIGNEQT
ncbi:hypothetical protein [Amygdalobacter nucleatus]|uniref:Uncharacterized protein n=1 Tax=Amygdalobacter nucleatus TaxID=3029274 RepID=A0A133YAD3_9FIRM|nr:hypothetical protein [Amygdalobacter nucleatus]KXB40166.1 hypothetical protein HMPREF1872_00977 [Amygdalobacter nucleatus]MDF0485804.1 hypothetical protein [Amygdalobacter nucleatus]